MKEGQNTINPIMPTALVIEKLEQSELKVGQRETVTLIMTSQDKIFGIQGYAGTGKTHMMAQAKLMLDEHNQKYLGLAPSLLAATILEQKSGISSMTLQKFLAIHFNTKK